MTSDDKIKKAFYKHGFTLGEMSEDPIDVNDDDDVAELIDAIWGSSECYSEILDMLVEKAGGTGSFEELDDKLALSGEINRGIVDGLKKRG